MKTAVFEPPASPCSLASEDKPIEMFNTPDSVSSLVEAHHSKAPRGISPEYILPDGAKRSRRRKILEIDLDSPSYARRSPAAKRAKRVASPRAYARRPNASSPRRSGYSSGAPWSSALEMVFVDATRQDGSSEFVSKLNNSVADERRKALLQRLRSIDAQKAKLACDNPESGGKSTAQNSRGTVRTPHVPQLDISSIANDVPLDSISHAGARLSGFNATPSPRYSSSQPNASVASPTMSQVSQDGLKRRASRCRTPSILLRSLPGENSPGVYTPPGISKCKRLNFCKKVTNELLRSPTARPFSAPVNELWPAESIPRYFDVISRPMDFRTIKRNLETGEYLRRDTGLAVSEMFNVELFERDVKQVFRNAMIYNSAGDMLYESAKRLMADFETKMYALPPIERRQVVKKKKKNKKVKAIKSKSLMEGHRRKSPTTQGPKKAKRSPKKSSEASGGALSELQRPMSLKQTKEELARLRKHRNYLEMAIASSPMTSSPRDHSHAALLYALEMTADEKAELTENIAKVPIEKLDKLISLIKASGQEVSIVDGEMEIEIDKYDNKTLRDIEMYVESCVDLRRKSLEKNSLETEYRTVEELDAAIDTLEKRMQEIRNSRAALKRERSFYDLGDSSSDSGSDSESNSGESSSESESDSDSD